MSFKMKPNYFGIMRYKRILVIILLTLSSRKTAFDWGKKPSFPDRYAENRKRSM
jgi:hypothetical protein